MITNPGEKNSKSLADITADSIIELVMKQNMKPGTKLPTEAELTQLLGVGRSTVREAVRRLVTRNILDVRQGSGIFVSQRRGVPEDPLGISLMKDQMHAALELCDVRLMLEPEFAAIASVKATEEQLEELEQLCNKVEKLILSGEDYCEADIAFHNYIASCSGSHVMENIVPIISTAVDIFIKQTEDIFRERSIEGHRNVLNAIKRRDFIGAKYSMAAHLDVSREYFVEKMALVKDGD